MDAEEHWLEPSDIVMPSPDSVISPDLSAEGRIRLFSRQLERLTSSNEHERTWFIDKMAKQGSEEGTIADAFTVRFHIEPSMQEQEHIAGAVEAFRSKPRESNKGCMACRLKDKNTSAARWEKWCDATDANKKPGRRYKQATADCNSERLQFGRCCIHNGFGRCTEAEGSCVCCLQAD